MQVLVIMVLILVRHLAVAVVLVRLINCTSQQLLQLQLNMEFINLAQMSIS